MLKQRWLGVTVGHSLRRGAGGQHRTSPGRAQGQPWSSLGVDQCPGALPEAKALGTEVLGVTTCRGWKGNTGEAGRGAGPPQRAHPACTGQGLTDLSGKQGGPGSAGNSPAAEPSLPQPPSPPRSLHRGLHPHPSEPRTSQQGRGGSPLQ